MSIAGLVLLRTSLCLPEAEKANLEVHLGSSCALCKTYGRRINLFPRYFPGAEAVAVIEGLGDTALPVHPLLPAISQRESCSFVHFREAPTIRHDT